ncbi:MAG: site-specific DNA-methyltransferase [Candidatus Eisenbacteria bacterium]
MRRPPAKNVSRSADRDPAGGSAQQTRLEIPGPAGGLLVLGDNLELMSALPAAVADLLVADPPFSTGQVRTGAQDPRGAGVDGAPSFFEDRWASSDDYLAFLRPRLQAMHRLLKPTGSIVVHLDYRAVHEVKLEMDRIFGRARFVNEIIWHYTGGGRAKRYFSRKHDTLLWYARGDRWTFNLEAVRQPYKPTSGYARAGIVAKTGKHYRPHPDGTPLDDVWELPIVNPLAGERCGYPTQKPERLFERILNALSRPGDLVIDPFCGSGTAAVVAARLGRRWIAADISPGAIAIARRRLRDAGGPQSFRERTLPSASPPARPNDRPSTPAS